MFEDWHRECLNPEISENKKASSRVDMLTQPPPPQISVESSFLLLIVYVV